MREYATTFSQTSCNPLDYPCLRLLTDESVTQLLHKITPMALKCALPNFKPTRSQLFPFMIQAV